MMMTETEPEGVPPQEPLAPLQPQSLDYIRRYVAAGVEFNSYTYWHAARDLLADNDRLRAEVATEREEKWKMIRAYNERGEQLAGRREEV